jgi:hypothetical protein
MNLIALAEIEPFVRLVPIDANGLRRSKMMPVLEMIRDDRPSKDPLQVIPADRRMALPAA